MESINKVKVFSKNEMVTIIESLRRNRDFYIEAIRELETNLKHPLRANLEHLNGELLELRISLLDCHALLSRIDDEGLI